MDWKSSISRAVSFASLFRSVALFFRSERSRTRSYSGSVDQDDETGINFVWGAKAAFKYLVAID
jgi:hypothetical protein